MTPRLIEERDYPPVILAPHQHRFYEILAQEHFDRRYCFGQLHITGPPTKHTRSGTIQLPDGTPGGWRVYHPVDMILHPKKGALLIASCALDTTRPDQSLHRQIDKTHGRLVDHQREIRRRLDESSFWSGRPIVLGIGVVVFAEFSDDTISPHIPPELILDCSVPGDVEEHLEQLFEFFATPASTPVAAYGRQLISDLIESPQWIGTFFDKTELCKFYTHHRDHRHPGPKVA